MRRALHRDGLSKLPPPEASWLDQTQKAVESIPASEPEFIAKMMAEVDAHKFMAPDYSL